MDKFDADVKALNKALTIVNNTESQNSKSTAQKAVLNLNSSKKCLEIISRQVGLLPKDVNKAFNSLQTNLNIYIKDPSQAKDVVAEPNQAKASPLYTLTTKVINRDLKLADRISQDLSNVNRLVRTKDVSAVLLSKVAKLPQVLKEGSPLGDALGKVVLESAVALTNQKNMGAGLERDLAVKNVYLQEKSLSIRQTQAVQKTLSASLAYIESNQPEILATIKESVEPPKEAHKNSTAYVMTRYLRKALNEFPEDSTYLDMFKQKKTEAGDGNGDELSEITSKRIHDLIAKAAKTARDGNLIPTGHEIREANSQSKIQALSSVRSLNPQEIAKEANNQSDPTQLSLSQLAARAAKLQEQFRIERQRMVAEGKLPDPAQMPEPPKAPTKPNLPKVSETLDNNETDESLSAQERVIQALSKAAKRSSIVASSLNALNNEKNETTKVSDTLLSSSVKISYKAIQNPNFGQLDAAPGMTIPVADFKLQQIADASQVSDFSSPRTLSEVLKQQSQLNEMKDHNNVKEEVLDNAPKEDISSDKENADLNGEYIDKTESNKNQLIDDSSLNLDDEKASDFDSTKEAPQNTEYEANIDQNSLPDEILSDNQTSSDSVAISDDDLEKNFTSQGNVLLNQNSNNTDLDISNKSSPDEVYLNKTSINLGKLTEAQAYAQSEIEKAQSNKAQNILENTIPLDELENNTKPSDAVLDEKSQAIAQSATQINPKADSLGQTTLTTPAAAAITSGGANPLPKKSVIENQSLPKESGFFTKIANIFGHKDNQISSSNGISKTLVDINNLNQSPLDTLLTKLQEKAQNESLATPIRESASKLIKALNEPVANLPSVQNWLNFTSLPLSPSSPQAIALHQWAFLILSLRFSQLGKSVQKFLKENNKDENLDKKLAVINKNFPKKDETISDLIEDTFAQIDRLQKLSEKEDENHPLGPYLPLPPQYDGGNEGSLSLERFKDDDEKDGYHLKFKFDLKDLGPIEIRATLKHPELKLNIITQNLKTLQKVQELLPTLTSNLQNLGLTTRPPSVRLGHVSSTNQDENDKGELNLKI